MRVSWILLLAVTKVAQAVVLEDDRGIQHLSYVPERIVSLSWAATEHVLELGVTPFAVADSEGYREWVVVPPLPDRVVDVGLRQEPNLEVLMALKPDLILVGSMQEHMIHGLERIAPVAYFDSYRADHNNRVAAERAYLALARALDREEHAIARLQRQELRLQQLKRQLEDLYQVPLPRVTTVRFMDSRHVLIYSTNAMAQYALDALGIAPALQFPASQWGFVQRPVTDLGRIEDGIVLYMEPVKEAERLLASPLWQAMPFVRQQRVGAVRSTWSYGGALSVGYLAEAIFDALVVLQQP